MRRITLSVAATAFAAAVTLVMPLTAQQPVREAAPMASARFAYLFGGMGEFVRIDLATAQMAAHWWLPRIDGLASVMPQYREMSRRSTFGAWALDPVASDGERLYLIVPSKAVVESDYETKGPYLIVALNPPMLELFGSIVVAERPRLLAGKDRLFVSAVSESTDTRLRARLDVYDAKTLVRIATFDQAVDRTAFVRGDVSLPTMWSERASLAPSEDIIVDFFKKITLGGVSPQVSAVDVEPLLSETQKSQLKQYAQEDPVSKRPWVRYSFAASGGGRAVYTAAGPDFTRMAVIVVDALTARLVSMFESPFGALRLTGDGLVTIVEQGEVRSYPPPDSGTTFVFKTGRLLRFDASTGQPIGEVFDAAFSGNAAHHATLCVGGAADPTLVAAESSVFVIDWQAKPLVRQADATFPDAAFARCAFTTR